jgi:hypothetical protein
MSSVYGRRTFNNLRTSFAIEIPLKSFSTATCLQQQRCLHKLVTAQGDDAVLFCPGFPYRFMMYEPAGARNFFRIDSVTVIVAPRWAPVQTGVALVS